MPERINLFERFQPSCMINQSFTLPKQPHTRTCRRMRAGEVCGLAQRRTWAHKLGVDFAQQVFAAPPQVLIARDQLCQELYILMRGGRPPSARAVDGDENLGHAADLLGGEAVRVGRIVGRPLHVL